MRLRVQKVWIQKMAVYLLTSLQISSKDDSPCRLWHVNSSHALTLHYSASCRKHGRCLLKSIQFSHSPLLSHHLVERFVTAGLFEMPSQGLGSGARAFCIFGFAIF